MSQQLSGKIALVTGGSRSIGAAIVRRFATDGAAVAFTYSAASAQAQQLAADIAAAGGKAYAIKADSADPAQVRAAVAATVERFGGLDILVNNAGILSRGMIDDFALEEFDRMLAVNVRAVFVGVQAALPNLKAGSRVITTGSVAAQRAGFPGSSVYSMTKAAVGALTRGLARDLGPRGITVNAIAPGPTATDMTADPAMRDMIVPMMPMMPIGRLGTPEDVASLAAWLAGPEAGFVNGASLTIDGGFMA